MPVRWRTAPRRSTRWRIHLLAWRLLMLDHDGVSMALTSRVFDGQSEGLTRNDVLDNITYYWFTNTAVSSARLLESKFAFFAPKGVAVPTAVSAFQTSSIRLPKAGQRKLIRSSSIIISSTNADTLRPGNQ